MENSLFKISNLSFAYDKEYIIEDLSFTLSKNKITTIMGSNGCGKSTLFNILTKNLKANTGKIMFNGELLNEYSLKDYAKRVAIVHQYNIHPNDLKVSEIVSYGRTPHKKAFFDLDKAKHELKVDQAMKITGVYALKDKLISELSGGQKQRVWIAMALAQECKVLFLDEPTTYLDIKYQISILRLIKYLNQKYQMSIIMVLHDINQALTYSDEIIAMGKDGKIIMQGSPQAIIHNQALKQMYDIDLDIVEHKGKEYVLNV